LMHPFESILELKVDELPDLPKAALKHAYESAKKVRERMDAIIENWKSS